MSARIRTRSVAWDSSFITKVAKAATPQTNLAQRTTCAGSTSTSSQRPFTIEMLLIFASFASVKSKSPNAADGSTTVTQRVRKAKGRAYLPSWSPTSRTEVLEPTSRSNRSSTGSPALRGLSLNRDAKDFDMSLWGKADSMCGRYDGFHAFFLCQTHGRPGQKVPHRLN